MILRTFSLALLVTAASATVAFAQASPATAPAGIGATVQKEVKNLSSDEFAEREAALKRLQGLVAEQLKQRAAIQDVLAALQSELAKQQAALAVVAEEAQAQISGLLEMERGLAGWTIQVMSEPLDLRKKLLDWGLSKENALTLARAFAQSNRARLEGIKQLAKANDETGGINWTLSKLINDRETPVRAAAMAAVWSRKPNADIVNALWYRAVAGPLAHEGPNMRMLMVDGDPNAGTLRVDFPGGEPMEFDDEDESASFIDAQLAADVLVHLNSDLVAEKVKALVAERIKAGKGLSVQFDPEWTLISHRLVEVYKVKEAIPMLAAEALGAETETMGGDMNGRPFMWSRRTIAIGTLATLIGKEPSEFELMRARNFGDSRTWMWATDVDQQAMMNGNMSDRTPMAAFYAFWKDHYKDYGVTEKPTDANIPPPPARGGRRGRGGPIPIEPGPGGAPDGKFPLNPDAPVQNELRQDPALRGPAAE